MPRIRRQTHTTEVSASPYLFVVVKIAIAIFCMSGASVAYASQPAQELLPDHVVGQLVGAYYGLKASQTLGTGWTGQARSLTVYAGGSGLLLPTITSEPTVSIYSCPDATYTSCASVVSNATFSIPSHPFAPTEITATFTPFTFDPTKFYYFGVTNDSSNTFEARLYGTLYDSFTSGSINCSLSPVCQPTDLEDYIVDLFFYFNEGPIEGQTGFNSTMQTRFTDLVITGTSTINILAEYFLDGSEIDTTVSSRNPNWVKFWFGTSTTFTKVNESIPVVAGTDTVDTDLSGLADGTYDLLVGFSNFGCSAELSDCPFPDSYVYTSFTVTGGVLSATGTNDFYDRTEPIVGNALHPCSLTQLSGCLINAGLFLFSPSEDSLDSFANSFEELKTTFPFVYAFEASDHIDTLFTATSTDAGITASTTLGTFTFVNRDMLEDVPYSSTFRTIIGYAMWLTFLWGAYRVVLRVFHPTNV